MRDLEAVVRAGYDLREKGSSLHVDNNPREDASRSSSLGGIFGTKEKVEDVFGRTAVNSIHVGAARVFSPVVGVGLLGVKPAPKGENFSSIFDCHSTGSPSAAPFKLIDEDSSSNDFPPISTRVKCAVNFGPFQPSGLDSAILKDMGAGVVSHFGSLNGWKRRA